MASPWAASRAIPTRGVEGSSWGNKPGTTCIRFLFATTILAYRVKPAQVVRNLALEYNHAAIRQNLFLEGGERMSTRLSGLRSYALEAWAGVFLAAVSAFCQPAKSALAFESVDIQRSK